MKLVNSFNEDDLNKAHEEWGANCGPASLAIYAQKHIDDVRGLFPDFASKGFVNPTMMRSALISLYGSYYGGGEPTKDGMFQLRPAIVRVQWEGPWTAKDANPRWAYSRTHWIVCWFADGVRWVYDLNMGIRDYEFWVESIVPQLCALHKRATGEWHPTHIFRTLS